MVQDGICWIPQRLAISVDLFTPKMGPRSPQSLGFHTIRLAHQFHCRWDWPEGCENTWFFGASVVKRLALRIPLWIGIFQVSSNLKLNKILKFLSLAKVLEKSSASGPNWQPFWGPNLEIPLQPGRRPSPQPLHVMP